MKTSYIVCTRNRSGSLVPTLDSIACQRNAELVIVNNGSSDRTREVVADWASKSPIPTKICFEPKPGLARARNAGILAASGDVIAFTDDDCRVAVDHQVALEAAHKVGPPAIIGGKVLLGNPLDAPVTILLKPDPHLLTSDVDICGFLHGCNMSMPRSLLEQVGGFDTRFGAGACFVSAEDTDYMYRAARMGFEVRYDPLIVVSHYHGRQDPQVVKKLWSGYMVGRGAMAVKHRDVSFIKPPYWHAKVAVLETLRGHKRQHDPLRPSAIADVVSTARGMAKALFSMKA